MGSPKKKWEVFSKHSFASIQKSAKLNLRSHFKFQEEARGARELRRLQTRTKKKNPRTPLPSFRGLFLFSLSGLSLPLPFSLSLASFFVVCGCASLCLVVGVFACYVLHKTSLFIYPLIFITKDVQQSCFLHPFSLFDEP